MISENQASSRRSAASKIIHKSTSVVNPRSRFVTEETVALLFNISADTFTGSNVVATWCMFTPKAISRFVSYADFPPIVGVNDPTFQDFAGWYKRWNAKQAPKFWTQFYTLQFKNAVSVDSLLEWGKLVGTVKSVIAFSATTATGCLCPRKRFDGEFLKCDRLIKF